MKLVTLVLVFLSGCSSCDTKNTNTTPDAVPCVVTNIKPSSQALCAETIVRSCYKLTSCMPQPNSEQLSCEMDAIKMCAGFHEIDPANADSFYRDCLTAIDNMTCEQFDNGLPDICKSFLISNTKGAI